MYTRSVSSSETYRRFYAIIRRIPAGKVATYGQIARLAGVPGRARQVGYALHAAPDGLPWQRVINAEGRISLRGPAAELQRQILIEEGVRFDVKDRIPLSEYQWHPESS
jgi:methylated-DNA-protein-cysteine methyltransferase-like protein